MTTLEWIDRHENLVVCGPSGIGKSHLLEGLGHAAIGHGCHFHWFSLEILGASINRHRVDPSTSRAIRKIVRADLICMDDIGLLPGTTETAEALYRVVDAAYEKRSIALSSNLHAAGFDELMPKTNRQRQRRPAPPPRPRCDHHRRLDSPHPSNPRQRVEATDHLNHRAFHWQSVGNSDCHFWADPVGP